MMSTLTNLLRNRLENDNCEAGEDDIALFCDCDGQVYRLQGRKFQSICHGIQSFLKHVEPKHQVIAIVLDTSKHSFLYSLPSVVPIILSGFIPYMIDPKNQTEAEIVRSLENLSVKYVITDWASKSSVLQRLSLKTEYECLLDARETRFAVCMQKRELFN